MADGKKIPIEISATGGDQAAAEFKKAETAAKELTNNPNTSTGFGGMLDQLPEKAKAATDAVKELAAAEAAVSPANTKLDELRAKMEALKEEARAIRDIGEASEEAAGKSGKLDENVERIARTQKAQAVAGFADKIADLGRGFQQAADDVEKFDRATAETLRNVGSRLSQVGNSVAVVAAAFAVGGPIGAAVASLGVFVKSVMDRIMSEWANAGRELEAAKGKLREIQQAEREAKTAADDRSTAIASATITTALEKELEYHQKITEEWKRQIQLKRELRRLDDEVLDEQDQKDLAEVDYDEASGVLTPGQAADKRAEIEGAARKRARDERKRQAFEDAQEAAAVAINAQKVANDTANGATDLAGKSASAQTAADDARGKAAAELSKMKKDKNGDYSDDDRKRAADLAEELERANNKQKAFAEAAEKAQEEAKKAAKAAADAIRDARDKGTIANKTETSLDAAQGLDDDRTVMSGRTRTQEQLKETRKRAAEKKAANDKKAADAAKKKKAADDRREATQSDVDTDGPSLGKDAADAARGLGARGGISSGLTKLGSAIGKRGNAQQDAADLATMRETIDKLLSIVEGQQKGKSEDAQKLRETVRKVAALEKKLKNSR